MASTTLRRPLPALIFLLGLLLLTALVWWRVISRGDGNAKPNSATSSTTSKTTSSAPITTCSTTAAPPTNPTTLPPPASVTVWVLNSTLRTGLAKSVQKTLMVDGFKATRAASNDATHRNKIKSVAEIRFGPAAADAAKLVSYYFPKAVLQPTNERGDVVTISLGAAFTKVATKKAVSTALAKAHVKLVRPATPGTTAAC
jgi:cytoskeletal protein RodZ